MPHWGKVRFARLHHKKSEGSNEYIHSCEAERIVNDVLRYVVRSNDLERAIAMIGSNVSKVVKVPAYDPRAFQDPDIDEGGPRSAAVLASMLALGYETLPTSNVRAQTFRSTPLYTASSSAGSAPTATTWATRTPSKPSSGQMCWR